MSAAPRVVAEVGSEAVVSNTEELLIHSDVMYDAITK